MGVLYVGERIKWFFERQKYVILEFMASLSDTPLANMYSPLYPKHARLIKQNEMIKHLVFQAYDAACRKQLKQFVELFDNVLTSTFSNPWVFLKGAAVANDQLAESSIPSFETIKERLPHELQTQSGIDDMLTKWLQDMPTGLSEIDAAVERVQSVVLKTYSFIRSEVCDQLEMFAESFFKLPMLRRLDEDMSKIELSDTDRHQYELRCERLQEELATSESHHTEIRECIELLDGFKFRTETRST